MTILVIAEHDNKQLNQTTLNTVTAATQLGDDIHLLVAGKDCSAVAQTAAGISAISRILVADNDSYKHALAENIAALTVSLAGSYSHVLAPSTSFAKNFMPRVAALLDVAQISDIQQIVSSDTFVRPVYAGNALVTVQSSDRIKLMTVRCSVFDPVSAQGGDAEIVTLTEVEYSNLSRFIGHQLNVSERPELISARVIIAGGRGMGSADNFALLEVIADKLNGAIGASRAAVDAGFVANDYQVGQTGKIVAPDLYIAVGISGAIQHLAGMKESRVIVAINKDEDAPIFQVADYGLVADLFEVLPELADKL